MHFLMLLLALSAPPDADYLKAFAPDEPTVVAPVLPRPAPAPLPSPAKTPPRPLSIEIFAPAAATAEQLQVTIYTAEDINGTGWCLNCGPLHKRWGDGDSTISLTWSRKAVPTGPKLYPAIRWTDASGKIRRPAESWKPTTLAALAELVSEADAWEDVPGAGHEPPQVYFGVPYFEVATGRTSVQHLMSEHGLTWAQIAPYAHDQNALDRIHGWRHTGRGVPAPRQMVAASRRRREPREKPPAATGLAGTIRGREFILSSQAWWADKIGVGNSVSIEWSKTGSQTVPLLSKQKITLISLIGNLGSVRVSAPGSKLPVQDLELGYQHRGIGIWRLTGAADVEFADDKPLPSASGEKVQFADPMTILTMINAARTIWGLLHPVADLTLPGDMSATAILNGEVLAIDFEKRPQIKAKWLIFNFTLGVRRIEITPEAVTIYVEGLPFFKSRTFKVTHAERQRAYQAEGSRILAGQDRRLCLAA